MTFDEDGIALPVEIFPAIRSGKVGPKRGLRYQNGFRTMVLELGRLHHGAPQVVFDDQKLRLGVRQQLQMLFRGQLVIEWHEHAAAEKDRVSRNQPFRLIGHDDRAPVPFPVVRILQGASKGAR